MANTIRFFNEAIKDLFALFGAKRIKLVTFIEVPWDDREPEGTTVNIPQRTWLKNIDNRRLSEVVEQEFRPLDVLNVELIVCYQNGSKQVFNCLTGESRSL